MAKHRPGSAWPTRPIGTYPQQYVQTENDGIIRLRFTDRHVGREWSWCLSRHDARMLARRINQCLDATK